MTASPQRWWQLALLTTVMLLGMAVWLAASAAGPALAAALHLTPRQTGWLTSAVQLGFVAGTLAAAVLNLADILPSRWFVAASAMLAGGANLLLISAASFEMAIGSRFLTGVALAGVYPPAMKMASTWFRDRRGFAIGAIVGALTIGKAFPYLISGWHDVTLARAIAIPSVMSFGAALVVAVGYRDGPYLLPARPFSWGLVGEVLRESRVRRATGGYMGHMWELYAFWAWLPGFLAAALQSDGIAPETARVWGGAVIALGGLGAVWAGIAADRLGRGRVTRMALVVSGVCCVLSPVLFVMPLELVLTVAAVWGIAVIADSAQFSAMVSEFAPPHAVGTALTLQTSLGFLLSIVTIQLVPVLAGVLGWQWAMAVLVLGPLAGIRALRGV